MAAEGAEAVSGNGDHPLPESGNVYGTLAVARKTDVELARGDEAEIAAIDARVARITTQADADAYLNDALTKVKVAQANRAASPPTRPRVTVG